MVERIEENDLPPGTPKIVLTPSCLRRSNRYDPTTISDIFEFFCSLSEQQILVLCPGENMGLISQK